ncbi:MAG: heme-binding domain-containing protein [Chlorobiales bacterium]|nr:heme-binding domain-containing protein [Chlorobiales bacterium]
MKKAFLIAVAILLGIQLIPINRENPSVTSDVGASDSVKAILKRACYDCHSNETVWPGYSRVAPVSWVIAFDVSKGREELNFSTWDKYDDQKKKKLIKKSLEEMKDGEMPVFFYVWLHPEAKLSEADINKVTEWATQTYSLTGQPEHNE